MYRKGILIVFTTLLLSGAVFAALNWWSARSRIVKDEKETVPSTYIEPFPDDSDRDSISNDEEKRLKLNPFEFDTDGDAVSDKDEIEIWKTDPKNVDTDGDGVRDGVEIIDGKDPNKK